MKQHSTPAAKPTPKPKPKPKAKEEESDPEELSLEEQVLNLLKVERRSHGQLVMNTDGTSGEIRALMNQLRGTGAVLLRRIGQTEFWELPE
jgi:hypothetical protein